MISDSTTLCFVRQKNLQLSIQHMDNQVQVFLPHSHPCPESVWMVLPNALCVRLNRKWELGIFTKMSTSPPILLKLDYFRHNYLESVLCSVSLLMHIWVQVEHSLLCRQIYT